MAVGCPIEILLFDGDILQRFGGLACVTIINDVYNFNRVLFRHKHIHRDLFDLTLLAFARKTHLVNIEKVVKFVKGQTSAKSGLGNGAFLS